MYNLFGCRTLFEKTNRDVGMKISLHQQLYIEDLNVLTFYNKAIVAIPYKVKILNCLHEFSITLMCTIPLFLLPLLIMF
jgi:hypothetical protein